MPPAARFGASKFRNAVPYVPGKGEWYRGHLPATTTSSSQTSTFSSEIKTNREWIVILTTNGDLSYRSYESAGSDDDVKTVKGLGSGGGVGDWDLSRLEGGILAVGGLDGSISIHRLPSPGTQGDVEPLHTIPSTSNNPITNIALHPTTPDILLTSTTDTPLAIYDLSENPSSPTITLNCTEPKGLWTTAWSPDGRLVAAIGKSGTCYLYDPRSSTEPTTKRVLPLQPLKPCRVTWVGNDIFVTSTSKMRNREYSGFSGKDLSTIFTNTLDTSPGILLPLVDQERKIVYVSAKGDQSLRQVELSGATGFQETLHPLPSPLASSSLALNHPATLPVMTAQIATVLVATTDKDGDALIPFGIRVPRRQLIDYHEDLYPDPVGTVPEQTASDWLKGDDRLPLPQTLDPSRRSTWEKQLGKKPTESPAPPKQESTPNAQPAVAATTASSAAKSETKEAPIPSSSKASPDLPPVEGEETHASTSYKARILGHHIDQQLESHRNNGKKGPLMVGLQGPQGCGKTTLCNALLSHLQESPRSLKIAILSLDDLYRTHSGLKELANKHPDNKLLSGRGPPGTHDVELATTILDQIQHINDKAVIEVALPIFDKSLCSGEGDRSAETVKVTGPLDVFILEGWSMGFASIPESDLEQRYKTKQSLTDCSYFTNQPLSSLTTLNTYLDEFSSKVYPHFETIIQVEPESYKYVFEWRLEQERNMKAKNGGRGMTDEQVHVFVERYMPGYELFKDGIWSGDRPWAGKGLRLWYGKDREVIKVERPEAVSTSQAVTSEKPTAPATTNTAPPQTPAKAAQKTRDPGQPYNANWSRKFLAGKSPLIPTYDQVPGISTLHQDSSILKCSQHLAFFPLAGPGGRIAVHPLKKKGRMDTGGESFVGVGVGISDFDIAPFEQEGSVKLAVAGEDGQIRVWKVPNEAYEGSGGDPDATLRAPHLDKILQLQFHPFASDILVVVGLESIHIFDLAKGEEASNVPIESGGGLYNLSFSPTGDRIAVGLKDKRILVLDPRELGKTVSGPAHDSPRSFQITWIDEDHLISVGFGRGSLRKINLHKIQADEIKVISSLSLDTSPSVLFPTYDPDTNILYVWGKGERTIDAYEVHPGKSSEALFKLPSFTAASPQLGVSFLSKAMVDVKKVEVAKALRLSAKSIEEVSFTIPRNKPEFFQDDIFLDTIDSSTPSLTAPEWLSGGNASPSRISLQPEGMVALSQAPQSTTKVKPKFVPAKDIMTEEEKRQQAMNRLFEKAKMDESDEEKEGQKGSGLAPPDDDDW